MASLFTAVGKEAKESAERKGVDLKKAYIRLKQNESVRVRILGVSDYVEYKSHGDFALGIYSSPCIEPLGQECAYCIAANSGIEGFDKLRAKKRYIFALYDIDAKELRFWDASKTQATKLIGQIEEYAEYIGETAFNFKRSGEGVETSYMLNPIMKLDAASKEAFATGDEVVVDMSAFESVLVPRTYEQQIAALETAGFPVADFFGAESLPTADVEGSENPLDAM